MRLRLLFPLLSLLLMFGGAVVAHAQTAPTIGSIMNCFLPNPAFCDNFSEGPSTGSASSRGGDLDPAKWSFSRITEGENTGAGAYFAFHPVDAMFCQTPVSGVLPDRDSFMCNGTNGVTTQDQGTEDMHWMTAMNDGGNYATIGAKVLQPFDFAGRAGTVSFMVDAVTQGPHSTWPSLVLSDQPINMPHKNNPGVDSPPRNGFQIDWNAGCGTPAAVSSGGSAESDYPQTKVGMVSTFTDYQEKVLSVPWQPDSTACVTAQADHPNLIQVQISQTSLDVYMADAIQNMQPGMPMTPPALKHVLHMDASNGYALNMTRGYLSFEQAQYSACKFNTSCQRTYHWHVIGFDGPVLASDRAYEVPDSLTPRSDGTVNIGYLDPGSKVWTIPGVDPSGAQGASVVFNLRMDAYPQPVQPFQVRVNGNAPITASIPLGGGDFGASNATAVIPVTQLVAGTNTVEIDSPAQATVANIDLDVQMQDDGVPTSTATATPTAAPSATPTATPQPTATPTASPTATPTATATSSSSSSSTATSTTSTATSSSTESATSTTSTSATATTAAWSTTVQVPAEDGGHHIPVTCTADPRDWHTLDCKASF